MTKICPRLYIIIVVCANNLPMLGATTTKLGTLMYYDKVSSKLQVCKQQQTVSGNKNL